MNESYHVTIAKKCMTIFCNIGSIKILLEIDGSIIQQLSILMTKHTHDEHVDDNDDNDDITKIPKKALDKRTKTIQIKI